MTDARAVAWSLPQKVLVHSSHAQQGEPYLERLIIWVASIKVSKINKPTITAAEESERQRVFNSEAIGSIVTPIGAES